MPSFNFVKKWTAPESCRANSVIGSFTLNDVKLDKRFKGELPLETIKWQIGVIVGRSGTGKTSIAKQLFSDNYIKNLEYMHASILDDFPENHKIREVTKALCSVGLLLRLIG